MNINLAGIIDLITSQEASLSHQFECKYTHTVHLVDQPLPSGAWNVPWRAIPSFHIYCDNMQMIPNLQDVSHHARTKHFRIEGHWVWELIDHADTEITYVRTLRMSSRRLCCWHSSNFLFLH